MEAAQVESLIQLVDNSVSLVILIYAWYTERKRNEYLVGRLLREIDDERTP